MSIYFRHIYSVVMIPHGGGIFVFVYISTIYQSIFYKYYYIHLARFMMTITLRT